MRAEDKNEKDFQLRLDESQDRIKNLEAELAALKTASTQNLTALPKLDPYLIDYAFCPKAILDRNSAITYCNDRFANLIGPLDEIQGRPITQFIPDLDCVWPESSADNNQPVFKKQSNLLATTFDKAILPIEAGLAYIQSATSHDVIVTLIDISERRKIEQSLLSTIDRLDLSLSGGSIAVWDWDIQNNVLVWDDSMYNLYEIDKSQFGEAYDAWAATIHPDDREATEAAVQTAIDGGPSFTQEFRIVTGNKKIKYISANSSVVRDKSGKALRMVGVNRDITKEKEAYRRLLNSESQLKAFFDLAPVGIARNDMEGKFIETNSEFERFTGYTTDELNELSYWHLTPHEYEEQENAQLESLQKSGKYGPYRKEYIHKNGHRFPVLLHGQIIQSPEGEDNIWSTVLDLSEIDQTNKKLNRSLEQLTQTNDELKRFAYVASHDLQEPLRVITSYLQLVEMNAKDVLDDKAKQYINRAQEASKRMRTLIVDLLSLSRVDNRKLELAEVNLNELLTAVIDDLSLVIAQTDADIQIQDKLPVIQADASLMQNVFQNLLSNAIKFNEAGVKPVIQVTSEVLKNSFRISVADNGIGIDPKYKDRIFEIFQRLHTRDDYSGNGIGLSIVKKIVSIHGGTIWFESTPNKGTTFIIDLPKQPLRE